MQKVPITVANEDGSPAVGATVQVRDHYSGLNLTLYEDNETTTKANPVVVGASGIAEFKIQNSVIDVIVTNGASTRTVSALKVSDGAELQLLTNGEGSALAFGDVCHVHTDGTAKLAHNDQTDLAASARYICLTRGGLANGAVGVFSGPGRVTELSGGVAGTDAWLDDDGDIMNTALDPTDPANVGKFRVHLGKWLSATALDFAPSEPTEI
jgi:hypothetical protein